jgi:DNA primase
VAPLGTALTEEQLTEIWRFSPEPVVCFDGDKAGRRAGLRAVELALGGLTPDRSLKFLRLPEGQDPDSLIRAEGAAGFAAQLAAAEPLSAVLYGMLAESANRDTPEGRAAFRMKLLEVAERIADKTLAGEYRSVLLDRFFAERRAGQSRDSGASWNGRASPPKHPQKLARPRIDPADSDVMRGRMLTAILIAHPALLPDVEEAFALTDLPVDCARLRTAFAEFHGRREILQSQSLLTHLGDSGLSADASSVLTLLPLPSGASLVEASESWWELFGLMRASRNRLREQRDEQQRRYLENPDDQSTANKLIKLNLILLKAERAES